MDTIINPATASTYASAVSPHWDAYMQRWEIKRTVFDTSRRDGLKITDIGILDKAEAPRVWAKLQSLAAQGTRIGRHDLDYWRLNVESL